MRLKYKWECPLCHLICLSRNELYKHKKEIHAGQIFDLGGSCQYCNREFTHKAAKSCHEKYCKLNPNKIEYKGRVNSQETRLKISITAKKNGKSGGYRQGSGYKNIKRGFYKGIWCDSSWELAFLIYCLEHNIEIKRNFDKFPYYIENELHYYIPDFIVGNTYIEIKGHIDNKCKYKFEQFPKDKHLKIYYANDMKNFLNYVYKKYGTDFINLYDNKNYTKKEKNIKINKIKLKQKENELNHVSKDIIGRYNHSILTDSIWNERKEKILSCNIDLMKFGWVGKVKKLTGLTQRELENTLKHFKDEFEGKYFKRN